MTDTDNTIQWIKPSGLEIETNTIPATVAEAERLGWKRRNVNDDGAVTLEDITAMTGAELKALIDECELGVSKTGTVEDIRAAVILAAFPAEIDPQPASPEKG